MTGFGQAAQTMRDDNAAVIPAVVMADGSQPGSHRRSLSGGLDPASWFAGRDLGFPTSQEGPSSRVSSSPGRSSGNGKDGGSKNASCEDNIYTAHPTRSSSSQLIASSSSDVGSSSGPRRSGEAKRQSAGQNPTPPTSYSLRKRPGSESHSLKDILGRLRGARGSSPGPIEPPEIVVQVAPPPPSAPPLMTRFPDSAQMPPPMHSSPYGLTISTRAPTPPSSLLRPQSPGTANFSNNRPTMVAPENGDRLWPPLTLPSGPSPAVSDDSHEVTPRGLLDPRLPWRLGQARADSSASLRDHEDYSRPIGKLVRGSRHFPTISLF
jgi:hypothetical protein